jgi:hypothetical protein
MGRPRRGIAGAGEGHSPKRGRPWGASGVVVDGQGVGDGDRLAGETKPASSSDCASAKLRRIRTSPVTRRARQVPHTPPLQANGRSGRTRWAPSRTVPPRGTLTWVARPVQDHGHLGAYGMVTDAIAVLTEFGVPRERVHQEVFYVELSSSEITVQEHQIRAELPGQLRVQQRPVAVAVLAPVVDEHPTVHHAHPCGTPQNNRRQTNRNRPSPGR